eukprot:6012948-Alexandrium_andersonii.AAC.1
MDRPCICGLLENVKGLATVPVDRETGERLTAMQSNLAACLTELYRVGYFAVPATMDPRSFAHPQSRPR